MHQIFYTIFLTFKGPDLPYGLNFISQAMVTSPDGMGVVIVGGDTQSLLDKVFDEKIPPSAIILESRFDGSKFLPWQVMDQKLENGRSGHTVIPIPKNITNCN